METREELVRDLMRDDMTELNVPHITRDTLQRKREIAVQRCAIENTFEPTTCRRSREASSRIREFRY